MEDSRDNCVGVHDPEQLDANQDGYGNACDADYDDDGVVGIADFVIFRMAFSAKLGTPAESFYDPDIDANGDGAIGGPDFLVLGRSFGRAPGPSGLSCAGTPPCPIP